MEVSGWGVNDSMKLILRKKRERKEKGGVMVKFRCQCDQAKGYPDNW